MLQQPIFNRVSNELKASWAIRKFVRNYQAGKYIVANPWRIGLVGCGRIARRHSFGYLSTGRARMVSGADPNPKNLSKAVRRFGLESGYLDFHEMLKTEELDIVSICAPPRFHGEAILLAVDCGVKAILCEKPIALDLDEADRVIKACKDAGVKLAIGHQRRFGPQHELAKKILDSGDIGQIETMIIECPRDILRAGIHAADFLRFYGGEVSSISAQLIEKSGKPFSDVPGALTRGFSGDTHGLILAKMQNSFPAILRIEDRGGIPAKIQFLGTGGELEVWFDGGMRYRKSNQKGWQVPELKLNPYLGEFHTEIEDLFDATQQHREPAIGGKDGRASLELIIAILTSAAEGIEVTLPLTSTKLVQLKEEASEPVVQIAAG